MKRHYVGTISVAQWFLCTCIDFCATCNLFQKHFFVQFVLFGYRFKRITLAIFKSETVFSVFSFAKKAKLIQSFSEKTINCFYLSFNSWENSRKLQINFTCIDLMGAFCVFNMLFLSYISYLFRFVFINKNRFEKRKQIIKSEKCIEL